MLLRMFSALSLSLLASTALASPDWSRGASVPTGGRANPYDLSPADLQDTVRAGRLHALNYPVTVSGVMLPREPIRRIVEAKTKNPILKIIDTLFGNVTGIDSMDDFEARFGLLAYPQKEGEGVYYIPFEKGVRPSDRMGLTNLETENGAAITVSCAQCHVGNLFGRRILGLTNRFPRANEMFVNALKVTPHVSSSLFKAVTEATDGEVALYKRTRRALAFIGAKQPVQLGLDTSLAQVAISLSMRDQDAWATLSKPHKSHEPLLQYVADSKPAVWWNLKYKNRWLSDGSVVSGNPIFTNFIWNEVGRGTDLHALDSWFRANEKTVEELTTAVFSAEAPSFTDFFAAESIPLESAKRGQALFEQSCARCHGHYEKAWDLPGANALPLAKQLETVQVDYRTRVIDVGTDPQRYLGMRSLVKLNDLEISKANGVVIEAQKGYVPPPLVGIWARWPYFHNNSAPSLCAVLSPPEQRPAKYWAREANDSSRDFDRDCNGYPAAKPVDARAELLYDTSRAGMRNTGHDVGVSPEERKDLIHFLQTL